MSAVYTSSVYLGWPAAGVPTRVVKIHQRPSNHTGAVSTYLQHTSHMEASQVSHGYGFRVVVLVVAVFPPPK